MPLEIFDAHSALLGKTGSGKTYTSKGAVERLLDKKKRVCIVDPTGVWWGLKSASSGKEAAYPVVIFGGDHADFPITRDHGAAIAEIVAGTDTPAIIDTSIMTVGDRTRFFTDFAETLLRKNKAPLNLFIDEAHNFMPQGKVPDPQAGKMLHAGNNLLSMGRARGLRITLISQRPQKLHKDSLTQAETLIAMRLLHNLDRRAVEDWIGENAEPAQGKEITKSLATLKTGEGWVWAPELAILERVTFPRIKTYDSSSAPTGDVKKLTLATIDPRQIEKMLGEAANPVQGDDPKALRAQIKELLGQTEKLKKAMTNPAEVKAAYASGYKAGRLEAYKEVIAYTAERQRESGSNEPVYAVSQHKEQGIASENMQKSGPNMQEIRIKPQRIPSNMQSTPESGLPAGEKKILTAIAQYPSGATHVQISILTGYKSTSRKEYSKRLVARGYAERLSDGLVVTPAGIEVLGPAYEPLPTGAALREHWLRELPAGEKKILEVVLSHYPKAVDADTIEKKTEYKSTSRKEYTKRLKARQLVTVNAGAVRAADTLF